MKKYRVTWTTETRWEAEIEAESQRSAEIVVEQNWHERDTKMPEYRLIRPEAEHRLMRSSVNSTPIEE